MGTPLCYPEFIINEKVKKGYYCVWRIHVRSVIPVTYRKVLGDEELNKIIIKTAADIEERQTIEREVIGCAKDHIQLLCTAHPKIAPGRKKSFGEESF
jgi:putative transposase